MRLRRNTVVAIGVGAYVIFAVAFLIMNGGRHLTADQWPGWLK